MSLKKQVEYCLGTNSATRNSDIMLMIDIWRNFYPEMMENLKGEMVVSLRSLFDLPREDNIKRIRAKIQNIEHKFLPTKLEIAIKRRILEDEWRRYMGYPPKYVKGQQKMEI